MQIKEINQLKKEIENLLSDNKAVEIKSINLKAEIINATSEYEFRLSSGKRHIIHLEAYVNTIIYVLNIK